jgi:hypothetical protein
LKEKGLSRVSGAEVASPHQVRIWPIRLVIVGDRAFFVRDTLDGHVPRPP